MPDDKAESKLREYNRWMLEWLTIHEALPGHYVQFEHANEIQPETRRVLARSAPARTSRAGPSMCAQVMMVDGIRGGDPRCRLSYLKIELRALANAILDVRLHTLE